MKTLLLALVLIVCGPFVANAQPDNQSWRTIRKEFKICHWDGCRYEHRFVRVRNYEPRVYGYEQRLEDEGWNRRDPRDERGISCKDVTPVRVVGRKHLTQAGAIKDAVGHWESTIGYDFGEKFASMENARGYRWRCDKASTNETALGKVGEFVGNVASGGTADTFYKRCAVVATPCMQPMQRGDEDKR